MAKVCPCRLRESLDSRFRSIGGIHSRGCGEIGSKVQVAYESPLSGVLARAFVWHRPRPDATTP